MLTLSCTDLDTFQVAMDYFIKGHSKIFLYLNLCFPLLANTIEPYQNVALK